MKHLLIAFLACLSGVKGYGQTVSYTYDGAGRLRAVVNPAGASASYTYDAAGNVTSIAQYPSGAVNVFGVAPSAAGVGAGITISGCGFSTVSGQNTVTFNGTQATVLGSTATQLFVNVPAGATSGFITVTAPGGSANSPTPFTVTANNPPTITGFSPTLGTAGTTVTVSGTQFSSSTTNNKVRFNGLLSQPNTASATSITVPVPSSATSGHLSVTTPYGSVTSSGDFFVPPGSYVPANVQYTGRMAVGGSQTVSLATAGQIGMLLFDGTSAHRISIRLTNVTIGGVNVSVNNPDGTSLINPVGIGTNGAFIESPTLVTSGTYLILLQPQGSNTRSLTINLYDDVDTTTAISPGGSPVAVTLSTPGQNAYSTFSETAGQRISLAITSDSISFSHISVANPMEVVLFLPHRSVRQEVFLMR